MLLAPAHTSVGSDQAFVEGPESVLRTLNDTAWSEKLMLKIRSKYLSTSHKLELEICLLPAMVIKKMAPSSDASRLVLGMF